MSRIGLALAGVLAVVATAGSGASEKKKHPPAGIAGKYPGDRGIAKDPAVLLHEDFEAAEIDPKKWSTITKKSATLKLVRERANVHGGKQALQVTATLGKDHGGYLFRRFATGARTRRRAGGGSTARVHPFSAG